MMNASDDGIEPLGEAPELTTPKVIDFKDPATQAIPSTPSRVPDLASLAQFVISS